MTGGVFKFLWTQEVHRWDIIYLIGIIDIFMMFVLGAISEAFKTSSIPHVQIFISDIA